MKDLKPSSPPEVMTNQSMSPLRIGDLLVSEGFVKEHDIKKAIEIQKQEKLLGKLPLGEILVKNKIISADDLESALNHPTLRKNIGSLAVEKGLIRKEDLEMCLKNKRPGQLIGELLLDFGLINQDDIGKLLKEQVNSPKLGEVLVDLKLCTPKDVQEALKVQRSTRAIGEILCDLKLISPQDLNYVLERYNKQIAIEQILLQLGFITEEQILEAKKDQEKNSLPLEQILIKKKMLTHEQLQTALAKKYNLPFQQLSNHRYNENDKRELQNLISQKYAEKNFILPLTLTKNNMTIGICKPEQLSSANELSILYPQLQISVAFITEHKFEELFEILYSKRLSSEAPEEAEEAAEDIDFMEIDLDENIKDEDDGGPTYGGHDLEAEELVNFIVKYGILNNASDIHIEQDRQNPKLRYRIDGILQEPNVGWLKRKLNEKIGAIVSRIKVMSNLDIAEKRIPQDGVFRINYYDKATNQKFDLDFRVATCRAIVGENVVIRILDSRKANVGLEHLGISPHVLEPLKRILKSSAGMILVSGPTGSGKSSTLYGALRYVYNPGVKIITAEDPIEYSFPGIMQTQIQPKIGITFVRLLRSFLRCDPDVILVGEVRDEETASIGFDAAQTGHLLLSTIHTNDSVSAISRLLDLHIEHSQIASCLLGVIAQRLIRKICPLCRDEYVPSEDEWRILFDAYPAHLTFFRGQGCEACNFSGYKGRTLISEVFLIDKDISLALSKGLPDVKIKKMAIEAGMKSMLEDGLMRLQETSLSELVRVIPHEMIKTFRSRQEAQQEVNAVINNLFDGTSKQSRPAPTLRNFLISDPESQMSDIDSLFNAYASANGDHVNSGHNSTMLFKKFIIDSYRRICSQYQCRNVSFTIHNKGGRAEIYALPES